MDGGSTESVKAEPVVRRGQRFLIITKLEEVDHFGWATESIDIRAYRAQPFFANCFRALKDRLLQLQRARRRGVKLYEITVEGARDHGLDPEEWQALEEILILVPSGLKLQFMEIESISSQLQIIPSSFLLRIRQHCFHFNLVFVSYATEEHMKGILANLTLQNVKVYSPPISPFALRSIDIGTDIAITISHISLYKHLGRAGPEEVVFDSFPIIQLEEGESLDMFVTALSGSLWVEWKKEGGNWMSDQGSLDMEAGVPLSASDQRMEDDLNARIDLLNRRPRDLRKSTRAAALMLLNAARLLAFALSTIPHPTQPKLIDLDRSHPPLLACAPSPISPTIPTSVPASTATSLTSSPILSAPYEVLDIILSHLSFGHLSSAQHRLVMNWAEDRSTLGANKADSRTDFLCKTNCWRWESEVERVNDGYGYQ